MSKRLSALQARVLATLATIDPPWTLTGGAALAGFHLGHRSTRDLDLFWHGARSIADVRRDVVARLAADGMSVEPLRTAESHCSLRVGDGHEHVVVDLVAEPVAVIEAPQAQRIGGVSIAVDTKHEILVNNLCALLHRSELRDLMDIAALVAAGGDLARALRDAPRKDGGFSALTLGWSLSNWRVAEAAGAAGLEDRADELEAFRQRLLRIAAGEQP
jgi:hypothetical protein